MSPDELDPANHPLAKAQKPLTVVSHVARDLAMAVQKNIDNTTTIRRESGQSTKSAYIRDTEIQREALKRQRDLIGTKSPNSQNDVDWSGLQGATDLGPLDEDLEQAIGDASSESLESDRNRRSPTPAEQEKERLVQVQPPEVLETEAYLGALAARGVDLSSKKRRESWLGTTRLPLLADTFESA
jgi:hypothetical protein